MAVAYHGVSELQAILAARSVGRDRARAFFLLVKLLQDLELDAPTLSLTSRLAGVVVVHPPIGETVVRQYAARPAASL
jgi:hypothetical protein